MKGLGVEIDTFEISDRIDYPMIIVSILDLVVAAKTPKMVCFEATGDL